MVRTFRRCASVGILAALVTSGALTPAGCGGQPETGARQHASAEEVEQRGKGIQEAMKSGGYNIPKPPPAAK